MRFRNNLGMIALVVLAACGENDANISVTDVWLRATPGSANASAGYAHIANSGNGSDRLLSVTTAAAGMAHVHKSAEQDGIMTMSMVDALEIPAKGAVDLKPGSYHIMLMGVRKPLNVGDNVEMTFTFERAGKIVVPAKVAPLAATQAPE